MVADNPKNNITLRYDWINKFWVNLFMTPMTLIGKFYKTFSNIVTMVLIWLLHTKKNIVFKGIHSDLDEEQLPENGIFLMNSFVI